MKNSVLAKEFAFFLSCYVPANLRQFKLLRLRRVQSWPGLYYGKEPTLKYWLAMTKPSVTRISLYFHDTRSKERAQIKQNTPLPNLSSQNLPGRIFTGSAQCLSGKAWEFEIKKNEKNSLNK